MVSMKIQFCDLCNESVPQSEFEQGRAFLRKGRIICSRCEQAMSTHLPHVGAGVPIQSAHAQPAAPSGPVPQLAAAPRSEGGTGLLAGVLAALALVMVVVVSLMTAERLSELEKQGYAQGQAQSRDLRSGLAELEARLAPGIKADQQLLAAQAARLESLDQAQRMQLEAARAESNALAAQLAALGADGGRVHTLERQQAELREALGAALARVDALGAQNQRLSEELGAARDKAGAAPAAAAPAPAAPAEPTWMALVRQLQDASPTERWSAVDGLGKVLLDGERAVVPHLLPMLKDSDTFVRMVSARVLGDAKCAESVGALIDALEDSEPSVREASAIALRDITGRDFGFDPLANEGERAKRVRAWRDWWKKAAEEFLGGK